MIEISALSNFQRPLCALNGHKALPKADIERLR